jgi:peptidoglycan/LPS O-acetylase OafA/YrhL
MGDTLRAENRRIQELDGLRGLAILFVISFHYLNNQLVKSENTFGLLIAKATSFGWVGVDLFFVLSGFLIGSILIRNKGAKNYFSTFYLRRLVRIVPNYYLLIVIFILIRSMPWFTANQFLTGDDVIPTWSYFTMLHNFFMAAGNNMGNASMSVTWSIGIEEQFYIFFPLAVYFLRDGLIPYFLLIAVLVAVFLRLSYDNWIPAYVLLPCRMDSIAFGAGVAWLNAHHDLDKLVKAHLRIFLIIIIGDLALCAFLYMKYGDLGPAKNTLFAIFFASVLICALVFRSGPLGQMLRNKYLMWIGTISYSLYLFHYMILGVFNHIFSGHYGVIILEPFDLIVTAAAFVFSLTFSWLVFKYLETPFVAWGKRFKY